VVCVHHFDKWWRPSEAWERYDYSHSDEELIEWVPKIGRLQAHPLHMAVTRSRR
jgi:hypothetical protein